MLLGLRFNLRMMLKLSRYPQAVLLLENFDELFAILSFTVERQYLHRTDALFAESLYGFKRCVST